MCTCEDLCMGRRSPLSVGRLTVLHVVDVVRLQDDRRIVKLSMHIIIISSIYEFVNGNGNRTRLNTVCSWKFSRDEIFANFANDVMFANI